MSEARRERQVRSKGDLREKLPSVVSVWSDLLWPSSVEKFPLPLYYLFILD